MLPVIQFSLFGHEVVLASHTLVSALAFISAAMVIQLMLRGLMPWWYRLAVLVLPALAARVGARLFHVLFEEPRHYWQHPADILGRGDGNTFYGSLAAGCLLMFFLVRRLAPRTRARVWDAAAISCALGCFWLKLGCFADGCCWGKMTELPWAVTYYDELASMPMLGIPVHPVQLYDAFCALLISAALLWGWRYRPAWQGHLFARFCVLYGVARFATEFFRDDGDRGVGVWPFALSNSQVISLMLMIVVGISLLPQRNKGSPFVAS